MAKFSLLPKLSLLPERKSNNKQEIRYSKLPFKYLQKLYLKRCKNYVSTEFLLRSEFFVFLQTEFGDIAQLARAFDWQSRGQGFDSPYLHE
jgi:hypothetical protein